MLTAINKKMSSSLEKLVPLFDGSNYLIWSDSMRAWLRSQGLWQITSGTEVKPTAPAVTTSTAAASVADAVANWNNRDDQAFGSLVL